MFSSKSIAATAWIFLILLVILAEAAVNVSDPTTLLQDYANGTSTPSQINSTKESQITNTTEVILPPTYVARSQTGQPCILASFNMSIRVSYFVAQNDNRYIAFRDFTLPGGEDVSGSVCGDNQSSLILDWANSTYNLNLTFAKHSPHKDGGYTNWTLDSIAFGYNLSNIIAFPGSSQDDYMMVEKGGLNLYNTEVGLTKECDATIKIRLGNVETATVITLEYVKLAAFNLTSEVFPETIEECILKSNSIRDKDIMVPLIIACALSFVIIVVVVAYAISRKIQEARDQSQYKPMP